jgi:histone acetyltransferase (RNA polymerase elongator complex component)
MPPPLTPLPPLALLCPLHDTLLWTSWKVGHLVKLYDDFASCVVKQHLVMRVGREGCVMAVAAGTAWTPLRQQFTLHFQARIVTRTPTCTRTAVHTTAGMWRPLFHLRRGHMVAIA